MRPRMSDLGGEVRSGCELDIVTGRDPSANRPDGFAAVFGGSPHVGHQRFERPEPQVIDVLPAHLVEQPGIDPRPDHRRRPQRILGLVVLGLRVGPVFEKVTLADVFELERPLPSRTGFLDGIGGQLEQHLNRGRCCSRQTCRTRCRGSGRSGAVGSSHSRALEHPGSRGWPEGDRGRGVALPRRRPDKRRDEAVAASEGGRSRLATVLPVADRPDITRSTTCWSPCSGTRSRRRASPVGT
jgi:hypothetical protein